MDYTYAFIRLILEHYEEIESIKYKVTSSLTPEVFREVSAKDADEFYLREGNTLLSRGSASTRVSRNSNARIESLCIITADIDMARKQLTLEEDMALHLLTSGIDSLPSETITIGEQALEKLVVTLNGP